MPPSFTVGARVECKDHKDPVWLSATVTSVSPLLLQPDTWEKPYLWELVRLPQEEQTCSICLDALGPAAATDLRNLSASMPAEATVQLPCRGGHRYHKRCIIQWLQSHRNCPLCRAMVTNAESNQRQSHYDEGIFDQFGGFRRTPRNDYLLNCLTELACWSACNFCMNVLLDGQFWLAVGTACENCIQVACYGLLNVTQQFGAACLGACDMQSVLVGIGGGITTCLDGIKQKMSGGASQVQKPHPKGFCLTSRPDQACETLRQGGHHHMAGAVLATHGPASSAHGAVSAIAAVPAASHPMAALLCGCHTAAPALGATLVSGATQALHCGPVLCGGCAAAPVVLPGAWAACFCGVHGLRALRRR